MTLSEAYALLDGDLMGATARLGSRALLVEYLRRFPAESGMDVLRAAHEAGDKAALWQAAHALRGACEALGLRGLADAASQYMAAPEAAWGDLERAYDRAVTVIGLVEDKAAGSVSPVRNFGGLRVLLAEDDRLCAEVSAQMLAGLGLRVRTARNGDEAVRLAREGGFDCVFLDAHMPGLDGVSVLRDIRQALPDAPIFALTAGLLPGEEECLRAEGLRACVEKPGSAEMIAGLLAECFPEE